MAIMLKCVSLLNKLSTYACSYVAKYQVALFNATYLECFFTITVSG